MPPFLSLLFFFYWISTSLWGLLACHYWRKLDWERLRLSPSHIWREAMKPFQRRESQRAKDGWRCLIGAVILFPIRLSFFLVLCIPHLLLFHLVEYIYPPPLDLADDLYSSRAQFLLLWISRVFVRIGMYLFGIFSISEEFVGGRSTLSDRREFKHIIISNHVSAVDVLYLMQRLLPSFVAHAGVARLPIVGTCARLMRCIFVNRSDNNDRERTLQLIQKRQSALSSPSPLLEEMAPPLVIFPEGTTSSGHSILPFRRGAFWGLKPVTPVVISYTCSAFNVSFDIIPIHFWFPLVMSSTGLVSLKAYWLPDVHPDIYIKGKETHEEKVKAFKDGVQQEMQAVLTSHLSRTYPLSSTLVSSYDSRPPPSAPSPPLPSDWDLGLKTKSDIMRFLTGREGGDLTKRE